MSKAVVRSRVATSRRCRSCGASVRPPRWLCSRCELTDESVTTCKMVDTDTQVQALRRNTSKACVSIASSLDTLPPASVPSEMRVRWLRALRQAARAVALVKERLAAAPEATR
jgi:hypothetical protein